MELPGQSSGTINHICYIQKKIVFDWLQNDVLAFISKNLSCLVYVVHCYEVFTQLGHK